MKFTNFCDNSESSLDVRFTKKCDNDCSFCIDKLGVGDLGDASVSKLITKTVSENKDTVLVLGGEPFLDIKKLQKYITGIKPYVKNIFITTSLPKSILKYPAIFDDIMRQINGLNVSILSTTSYKANNKMLNASSNHDRLKLLEKINLSWGYKIRTSINLVKGGIDDSRKLFYSLVDLEVLGCRTIKIVELQNTKDLYVSYEEIMNKKLPSPYSSGCQTKIDITGIEADLILKRSCFIVEESLNASIKDLIKSLIKRYILKPTGGFSVLYEDASVKRNWIVA